MNSRRKTSMTYISLLGGGGWDPDILLEVTGIFFSISEKALGNNGIDPPLDPPLAYHVVKGHLC